MSAPLQRELTIRTTTILKVVAVLAALFLMWLVRDILALLVVSLFLAALMHPAVRWGAQHRIPKGVTVIGIYLALLAATAIVIALIIPTLVQQVGTISQTVGGSITTFSDGLRDVTHKFGLDGQLDAGFANVNEQLSNLAGRLFSTLGAIFGGIAGLVIILVMAFYMVVEENAAVRLFRNFMPDQYQEICASILMQVEEKMGRWLSGQLMLSFIIGILYYVGLLVLGVDGALTLAIFGGFTEFIPYLGPILGGIPILLVAFSDSPVKALLAFGLVVLIQQVENQIIVPKVMQRAVGLSPLISIVAVLVGVQLFGVVGALLAIPLATALSVTLTALYRYTSRNDSRSA